MTDKKTEALKLALEALKQIDEAMPFPVAKLAQQVIREALAGGCQCPACKVTPHASDCAVHNEPAYPNGSCDCGVQQPANQLDDINVVDIPAQHEPVAYSYTSRITGAQGFSHYPMPRFIDADSWDIKPLYTSPQPSKPWVGLTDEEIKEAIIANCGTGLWVMANDIEAKLQEKNT